MVPLVGCRDLGRSWAPGASLASLKNGKYFLPGTDIVKMKGRNTCVCFSGHVTRALFKAW